MLLTIVFERVLPGKIQSWKPDQRSFCTAVVEHGWGDSWLISIEVWKESFSTMKDREIRLEHWGVSHTMGIASLGP